MDDGSKNPKSDSSAWTWMPKGVQDWYKGEVADYNRTKANPGGQVAPNDPEKDAKMNAIFKK